MNMNEQERKKRERQNDKYLLQFRLRGFTTNTNLKKVFVMRAIRKEVNCGTLSRSLEGNLNHSMPKVRTQCKISKLLGFVQSTLTSVERYDFYIFPSCYHYYVI